MSLSGYEKKKQIKTPCYSWIMSARLATVKILKIGTPEIITIIVLQLERILQCNIVFKRCRQNNKQRRPWSDCSMRSSLIWVCTVCSDLSVPIFKNYYGILCTDISCSWKTVCDTSSNDTLSTTALHRKFLSNYQFVEKSLHWMYFRRIWHLVIFFPEFEVPKYLRLVDAMPCWIFWTCVYRCWTSPYKPITKSYKCKCQDEKNCSILWKCRILEYLLGIALNLQYLVSAVTWSAATLWRLDEHKLFCRKFSTKHVSTKWTFDKMTLQQKSFFDEMVQQTKCRSTKCRISTEEVVHWWKISLVLIPVLQWKYILLL